MPRVTVLLPCHDHAAFVEEAVRSVMTQTHDDVELIVIDDGSSDGSAAVLERVHRRAPAAFQFLRQENQGLVATLQRGLELATGTYVCELASDDSLPPESLARRVAFLESHPSHVGVFTDACRVDGEARTDERLLDDARRTLFEAVDPIPTMLRGVLPIFATGLFRTEALRDCGGFDAQHFRFYEDLDTPVRLALAGRLGQIDEPLFWRREHASNVSSVTGHVRRELATCYEQLLRLPACAPYTELLAHRRYRAYLALGQHIGTCSEPDARDVAVLRKAWPLGWWHPRLLYHLVRHAR